MTDAATPPGAKTAGIFYNITSFYSRMKTSLAGRLSDQPSEDQSPITTGFFNFAHNFINKVCAKIIIIDCVPRESHHSPHHHTPFTPFISLFAPENAHKGPRAGRDVPPRGRGAQLQRDGGGEQDQAAPAPGKGAVRG